MRFPKRKIPHFGGAIFLYSKSELYLLCPYTLLNFHSVKWVTAFTGKIVNDFLDGE